MALTPLRGIAFLALSLLWGLARAQDGEPYAADPPDRAARLSYIAGDVSLQPAGEAAWAPAIVNRPLTTGDQLWTAQDARAEIYVGPAAVRLDGDTGFSFLKVDDDTIQMRLTAGVINVSVRNLDGDEHIEIATPNVALSLLRAGNYRVEVNDAGDSTVVKVSEGAAQATGLSQDSVVHAQQVVTFRGTDDLVAQFGTLGAPDEFDSWSLERDRRDERVASSRTAEYVSPDVTGYEDLEDNGTWSSETGYGYVWTPRYVAVDWAPYRYGRWVSISPWGWTWIDDARWGYAPFHYGRWAHVRNRWCWVPGPRHARAVYAPAHVGWVGSSRGNVSWFPLAPRERGSKDAIYRNRAVPGGVTSVPRTAFTSAGRTGNHRVRLNQPELTSTQASAVAPQIAPVRVPPRSIVDRQVIARDRTDRPRVERPVSASVPPARTSVFDRQALAERVRQDRDRQGREVEQRQQREAALRQRSQRQDDHPRQQREPPQVPREQQRERPQAERPQAQRPQVERPNRSEVRDPAETRSPPHKRSENYSRPNRD